MLFFASFCVFSVFFVHFVVAFIVYNFVMCISMLCNLGVILYSAVEK